MHCYNSFPLLLRLLENVYYIGVHILVGQHNRKHCSWSFSKDWDSSWEGWVDGERLRRTGNKIVVTQEEMAWKQNRHSAN